MPETEADTCRMDVLPRPRLYDAGRTDEQINEQHSFTDGRVIPTARRVRHGRQNRTGYPLRFHDFSIGTVKLRGTPP